MTIQVFSVPWSVLKAHADGNPTAPRWYCQQAEGYLVWIGDAARLFVVEAEARGDDATEFAEDYLAGSTVAASRDEACFRLAAGS